MSNNVKPAFGCTVEVLVERSISENEANAVKAVHNATAATGDLLPYDNSALCDLIDAVDNLLEPNAKLDQVLQ